MFSHKAPAHYLAEGRMVHHVEFSDDKQVIVVAAEDGFSVHKSSNAESLLGYETVGSLGLATLMGKTQIFGLIGGGTRSKHDQHTLSMFDTIKGAETAIIQTAKPIVRVRLTEKHIVTVHQSKVRLCEHQPNIKKIQEYDTSLNPLGLCCLGTQLLIFPGESSGQVHVVSLARGSVTIIPAHSSPLQAIEMSIDEKILACASEEGILICVYSLKTYECIAELRRGISQATILSLAISPSNNRLASTTSDTNTLHIFDLPTESQVPGKALHSRSLPYQEAAKVTSPAPSSKYGTLSKMPFAPRIFKDIYSIVHTTFNAEMKREDDADEEVEDGFVDVVPGVPGGSRPRGVAAWISDTEVVVINAGRDARHERYVLSNDKSGKVVCKFAGWSRFEGN